MEQGRRPRYRASKWVYLWKYQVETPGKADSVQLLEGRSPVYGRKGECTGHHRGLRTGHVSTGITQELERASCFLSLSCQKIRGTGDKQEPRRRQVASSRDCEPEMEHKGKEAGKVLGSESEKRSDPRRATGSRSGA